MLSPTPRLYLSNGSVTLLSSLMPHVVMKRHDALRPRGVLHGQADLAVVALLDGGRVEEALGLAKFRSET